MLFPSSEVLPIYEQKMSSLLNGDSGKAFQEHFVQWVDMDTYDEGIKLVSWTMQNADNWKQKQLY